MSFWFRGGHGGGGTNKASAVEVVETVDDVDSDMMFSWVVRARNGDVLTFRGYVEN